jgi:hypothetical protein
MHALIPVFTFPIRVRERNPALSARSVIAVRFAAGSSYISDIMSGGGNDLSAPLNREETILLQQIATPPISCFEYATEGNYTSLK